MSHVTQIPLSRSKGQGHMRGGGILWRPPAYRLLNPQYQIVPVPLRKLFEFLRPDEVDDDYRVRLKTELT